MKNWQINRNRKSNLNILKHIEKRDKDERVNALADKFKDEVKEPVKRRETKSEKFVSEVQNDYTICESMLKRK